MPTHGAALQAEITRLQSLIHDQYTSVFPPLSDSYFSPYGDRTIVSLQFPRFAEGELTPQKTKWHKSKPKHLKKATDFGLVITQNYIFRKNVRDYGNFSKIFANSASSQTVLQDFAKLLLTNENEKKSKRENSKKAGKTAQGLSNLLNVDILTGLDSPGYQIPPIPISAHPSAWQWGWKSPLPPPKSPTFAIVLLESRVKMNDSESTTSSQDLVSFTNGSLIFPALSNPQELSHVPFILRKKGDIHHIFSSPDKNALHPNLSPYEKDTLLSFLSLVEGLHTDSHADGVAGLERVKQLANSLNRARLPVSNIFADDPLEKEEEAARQTRWLYTSTVAIRKLSPPKEIKLYPVVFPVPIIDSYREHPLNVVEWPNDPYGAYATLPLGGIEPVIQPAAIQVQPLFSDALLSAAAPALVQVLEGGNGQNYGQNEQLNNFYQRHIQQEQEQGGQSSSSYFYRTIK